jgi:exodeoxyribonuclease VII small subunit
MKQDEKLSYEKAFARLEKILQSLNEEKVSLDESLSLFQEADMLIKTCSKQLTSAEKKIEMLIKNRNHEIQTDENGNAQTQPFSSQNHQILKGENDQAAPF